MNREEPQQTLERWLHEYRGLMLKVALSFTSHRPDQDDLMQEIALALWKSISQFRADSKESTWVYKVALFTATTWSRKRTRRQRDRQTEHLSNEIMRSPDPRQEWLLETIRSLPVDDSTVLLSALEGYSHEEIAGLTGLSVTNVGVRLHRLKKNLAQLATEHFHDI